MLRISALFLLCLSALVAVDASPPETIEPNIPSTVVTIGGVAYFGGTTAQLGRELWSTDGTTSGTQLIKDIVTGTSGSDPRHLTVMDGKIYFSANDGINGRELWVSDGTSAGTHIVKDIASGLDSSNPHNLYALGSLLIFTAYQPGVGYTMWASDGTDAGTGMIKDIDISTTTDEFSYNWGNVYCAVGSSLFFNATDATHGSTLWVTDGSASGTRLVKNIAANQPGSIPVAMTSFNGHLFYTSRGDNCVWKSDGTDAGTVQFSPAIYNTDFNTSIGGQLYIRGTNGSISNGIWVTDGYPAHLTLLSMTLTAPGFFVARGSFVYMNPDAPAGYQYRPLVGTDGTLGGTGVVADVSFNLPWTVGSTLYFSSPIGANGRLWKSDGSSSGTVKVTDRINNAAVVGQVNGLAIIGTTSDWNNYSALWASTGNDADTVQLFPRTTLNISSPTSSSAWSTTLTSFPLAGTASDPSGITSVTYDLSGATTASGTATGTSSWTFTPTLNFGTTNITITAHAGAINTATSAIAVMVNVAAPTLAITAPVPSGTWVSTTTLLQISGTASGAASITSITYDLTGATISSGTASGTNAWRFNANLVAGHTTVTVTAHDSNGHSSSAVLDLVCDLSAPDVVVVAPTSGGTYSVATPAVAVSGTASDDGGVVSISYALTGATTDSGTATGTTAWGFTPVSLNPGMTTVTITAHDIASRSAISAVMINYTPASSSGSSSSDHSCGLGSALGLLLVCSTALFFQIARPLRRR